MKTFEIEFTGRKLNSIGIFYPIKTTLEATDLHSALLKLYETYDHISNPIIKEVKNESNE